MELGRYTVAIDRTVGRRIYPLHVRLYRLTGGRVGHWSPLGPMLLLTTTGRRSGQPRTTPLLYMPDGADYLVVASNGGRDQPPAWLLNLESSPRATVQAGRATSEVETEILRGDHRASVWPRLVGHYSGWDHYQQLTERDLPAVRLRALP